MTFERLKLLVSVMALAAHSLAAPSPPPQSSAKSASTATPPPPTRSTDVSARMVRDTLVEVVELTSALMTGSIDDAAAAAADGRKSEVYEHEHDHHGYYHKHHHAISTLIHLLFSVGTAFAPLVGAIVGPLLTNIANGITWAITNTIASGFSSPHGLLASLHHGHGIEHVKEHLTSYTAEGQLGTGFQVQQPVDAAAAAAVVEQAEPATVDDRRNEVKKP